MNVSCPRIQSHKRTSIGRLRRMSPQDFGRIYLPQRYILKHIGRCLGYLQKTPSRYWLRCPLVLYIEPYGDVLRTLYWDVLRTSYLDFLKMLLWDVPRPCVQDHMGDVLRTSEENCPSFRVRVTVRVRGQFFLRAIVLEYI